MENDANPNPALIQPMDQNVIQNIKLGYRKLLLTTILNDPLHNENLEKNTDKSIYLNAGLTCSIRLGRNRDPAHSASSRQLFSHHCLKITLFQISVWNPDWAPNLGYMGGGFPLELFQQFLIFASSMGMPMQEDDTIIQHTRAFASDGFTMAQ
ncbi:hypothetical protein AVEN_121034-1 [Araneus ventricosus]|uniref:Uncharacterized protein n=1 Tax=Araneus ventricosus TaxID=182803 RepID=A0A4Y2F231_ARAVE|nr:hypothetical protein AVEN_121034-1 [Araneus ventricosus]